jgi:hypothetical protein
VRTFFTPSILKVSNTPTDFYFLRSLAEETAVQAFKKIILVASINAVAIGLGHVAPDLRADADVANSSSLLKQSTDRTLSDPDRDMRDRYSLLGTAKINGSRAAVYVLQNGARPGDVAGPGRGFADVFDSAGHLMWRFIYRENLNSPPQIIEYFPTYPVNALSSVQKER